MTMLELYPVQDVLVTRLGRVDMMPNGLGRFVFYVERPIHPNGPKERIVAASIVMSLDELQPNRQMVEVALATKGPAPTADSAGAVH